ncbi:adenylate/guanylate cyclase domain-containing protein [Rhizobium sp. RU36D]|uniref:adenylate/guanylate cyclase domain-containing protein n=1 Tax=Rhizobium sp. RU36D TaxID=1907415 RepID=UPI0009D90109|nr:adenylate/guanylate cyclase domain-containing protein [Rhizobium sp. RU36D]SMC60610.1 adenylate cyclase /adenylate/guanylate cyclase [Rhizobium sp. RU36D]
MRELELLAAHGRPARSRWRLPNFLWLIARIGTAGYPPRIRRRLAVTNVISSMVSLMTVPYILLYAVYDLQALKIAVLVFSPQIILFAITPYFHRFGSMVGAVYLCMVWLVFGIGYCLFFGRESGLHFYFLPGAAASMLIFGSERLLLSGFVTFLALCGFLTTEVVFVHPAPFIHVDQFFLEILFYLTVPFAFLLIFTTVFFAFKEAAQAEMALEEEYRYSERLLENILPQAVARRLKQGNAAIIADHIDDATILFADIVNFTPRSAGWQPQEVVSFLSHVFGRFDELAARLGLEKIKTIGDAYMAAGGLPEPRPDHRVVVAEMALGILDLCREISRETGQEVTVRIGLDAGPVVAGVIGTSKLLYDVWGDTVNTAARMESHGVGGHIQVPNCLKEALEDRFTFERRGDIAVKGKGIMQLWFLTGKRT